MKIRKLFKFCSAHIVRGCTSTRCSQNLHGHNYTVEVIFESPDLDNGGMVLDFGLTKKHIKDFIDGFDHCWQLWDKENQKIIDLAKLINNRWIVLPLSPSAENYAIMFHYIIDTILNKTEFKNGERPIVDSVIVHETDTGYAQSSWEDVEKYIISKDIQPKDFILSNGVLSDFHDKNLMKNLQDSNFKFTDNAEPQTEWGLVSGDLTDSLKSIFGDNFDKNRLNDKKYVDDLISKTIVK